MLELANFEKSYGSHLVLDIKRAQLPFGTYWLRGKNGSGKSSLLRSIAGATTFKGNVFLEGLSLKVDGVAYRRLVNFAEAEPVYPEFLTGNELIGMFDSAKGKGSFPASQLLKEMEMGGYVDSPIGSYSSGMLKKLSLVLAFLGSPKWILLDEPLNTLDLTSLSVLYNWIERAYQHHQISFILSSHQRLDIGLLPFAKGIDIVSSELVAQ